MLQRPLPTILDPANDNSQIERALRGEILFGDDFPPDAIERWFLDEAEGYAGLVDSAPSPYRYGYHALNEHHGYRFVRPGKLGRVLGYGSAYGDELRPIAWRASEIFIVEPSDHMRRDSQGGVPLQYVKPRHDGRLPFADNHFDLITCFGALHHVPNVSAVLRELSRCLSPTGRALVREPITSLGDWRRPRHLLTRRERGFPLPLFRRAIEGAGFRVLREQPCMFSLSSRFEYLLRRPSYNVPAVVLLDQLLASLPIWPKAYHASRTIEKLRATSVFYVLDKASP